MNKTTPAKTTGICKVGKHDQCSGSLQKMAGGGPCGCPCHIGQWTAQRVKDELPDVDILVDNKLYRMIVRGRQLPFAHVQPFDVGSAVVYEFSWQTIADCLNKGVPLRG